jgi:hypothetical protein
MWLLLGLDTLVRFFLIVGIVAVVVVVIIRKSTGKLLVVLIQLGGAEGVALRFLSL